MKGFTNALYSFIWGTLESCSSSLSEFSRPEDTIGALHDVEDAVDEKDEAYDLFKDGHF